MSEAATDAGATGVPARELPDTRLGRRLREHRAALLTAVAAAGASNLGVFGSVARGEDSDTSDVDLLVDLPDGTGLLQLLALEEWLEQILQARVELATLPNLRPRVGAEALRDGVLI